MHRILVAVVAILMLAAAPAVAADGQPLPLSPDLPQHGGFRNYFGQSVDIDRSTGTIVVGAWGRNERTGVAYVVQPDGAGWHWTELRPVGASRGARAGSDVSIHGDLIAVGAPLDDRIADEAGAVYLYRRVGDVWLEEAVLAPEGLAAKDWFGYDVDVDGDRVAIGAPTDGAGDRPGSGFVFVRVDGEWRLESELGDEEGIGGDYFGRSILLLGDLVAVGASGVDGEFIEQGAVYLYRHEGEGWNLEEKVVPLEPFVALYFGVRMAGDGERIAVTASGDFDDSSTPGRVYLLTPGSQGWEQTIAYQATGDHLNLGTSVVIDGGTIWVAAMGSYNYERQTGSVLVLAEGDDGWSEVSRLRGETRFFTTENGFGWSMAGDGDMLVIGAPLYRPNGEGSGEAWYLGVAARCRGQAATILGTPGPDTIAATPEPDVIITGSGDDLVTGVGPDDLVCTQWGNDVVHTNGGGPVADRTARDRLFVRGWRLVGDLLVG